MRDKGERYIMQKIVRTTYSPDDVKVLLKDVSGYMQAIDTEDREKMIQSGVHYSEMLPLEYKPTDEYIKIYNDALEEMSDATALSVASLCRKLNERHGGNRFVIISLARAGTPIGILVRRYMKAYYSLDCPHFTISIIRGKGIDVNAMDCIRAECGDIGVKHFQFLDGWTGKGAISNTLTKAVDEMKQSYAGWDELSDDLAVLADPANICDTAGSRADFLIPSACLNSTVSGLMSRTILRDDLVNVAAGDFHGAVYFEDLESEDRSIEFIDTVTKKFSRLVDSHIDFLYDMTNNHRNEFSKTGMQVVEQIAKDFGIDDVNKIKPGVGETTRVLLRRMPHCVLVDTVNYCDNIEHIMQLCEEKGIPVYEYDIGNYRTCGIIKDMSADV